MADIIYLTLNGNKQGLISAGCSSYDSIGNRYQNNHSDEILVYSTDYDISRHQNISHAPFVFEKADDKSSALLLSSILGSGTLLGEFGYITVTIYIIYGSFLIPLIACLCEIFIRLLYRYLYRFY
ncbi:TPA: type VI secretion system tube protein Hcp [Proteus mirabilis]|nr:type VI secretion system tube protein Hcp [Proteus mirabilis]